MTIPEQAAIEKFQEGMVAKNLDELKGVSSPKFTKRALRHTEAGEDLAFLRIPNGETKVTNIEQVNLGKKRVTVEITDEKDRQTKVLYELVRGKDKKEWLVNDVYLRQKKDGVEIAKSVTEQMDLLLSVREFMQNWGTGERDAILASVGPEMRKLLDEMPPAYLARMSNQVSTAFNSSSVFKPIATIEGEYANVKMPMRNGDMNIVLSNDKKDGWVVQDFSLENKDNKKQVNSFKQMARVINSAGIFLESYEVADLKKLEGITTTQFFNGSLSPSDLTMVSLPTVLDGLTAPEIKIEENRAHFSIQTREGIVQLSMIQKDRSDAKALYIVDNVTIYDTASDQRKSLSSLLTSRSMALLVCTNMQNRELPMLKQLSTRDLNEQVWERLHSDTMRILPIDNYVSDEKPEIISTSYQGALTEITVRHGSQPVVYVFREFRGDLQLDDVKVPHNEQPDESFKAEMAGLVPLYEFIAALDKGDLQELQNYSSFDFNRRIWTQTKEIPQIGADTVAHLMAPVSRVDRNQNELLYTLGKDQFGARVHLIKENGSYRINDAVLLGSGAQSNVALKQAMRQQITFAQKLPASNIQTVSGSKVTDSQLQNADYTSSQNGEAGQDGMPPVTGTIYREPQPMESNPLLSPIPLAPR
jgi:hypothetical protein